MTESRSATNSSDVIIFNAGSSVTLQLSVTDTNVFIGSNPHYKTLYESQSKRIMKNYMNVIVVYKHTDLQQCEERFVVS